MDTTLRTIYLRLNKSADTLAKTATQQLVIKILFQLQNRVPYDKLFNEYKNTLKRAHVSNDVFDSILHALVESNDIKYKNNEYYISTSKREKIKKACLESEERINEIVSKYFSALFSTKEDIKNWLQDVTIHFFNIFSEEWISDLVRHQNNIKNSSDAIYNIVSKRTRNIPNLDKRDGEELVRRFYRFITDNTPEVNAYLWEYGTSAFSAKLISNKNGVDSITLNAFRNSKCILDTNILMFIALEASKNHNALVAIEKAFNALNIEVGILNITKEEYKCKVAQQETETLTNISKFGIDTASLPDDDFTKTAIGRRCQTEDDFKRYFKELQHLPEFIDKAVKIQLFDSDPVLEECIIKAQNDEHKTEALNRVYVEATGHSKRKCPLMHDVGLIAGAEYLRLEDKYFVLSEEISINDYSKQSPISHNLPLSIRVLTLINILAMDNGGAEFSADDYMPLFATIIRNGLQPNKNVFQQADLLKLYQLNNQLASLPQRETQDIIKDMHELMVKGEDSDKLSLELDRRITMGKETAKQKEEILRDQLSDTQRSFEREKLEREKKDDALRKVYQGEAQKHHRNKLYKYLAGFLGIIFLMGIVLYFAWTIGDSLKDTSSFAMSLLGGVIIDFILAKIAQLKAIIIHTVDLVKNKSKIISKEVEDKMASI